MTDTVKGTKKILILLIAAVTVATACEQRPPTQTQSPEKTIAQMLSMQIDSFAAFSRTLQTAVDSGTTDNATLQRLFLQTRIGYKQFEWAAEYFEPATTRMINGPPVEEVEPFGQTIGPTGLQVIETWLYPVYDTAHKEEMIQLLNKLQQDCATIKKHFANVDILDWQVFDAAKQEVFRVETLGITGFDDPLSLQCMTESGIALRSLKKALSLYTSDDAGHLLGRIDTASDYLFAHTDFNAFNRAEFITMRGDPIAIGISDLQIGLKVQTMRYNRLLNQDAKTLFDTNAFNVNAYMPERSAFMTDEKVALGKKLFSDPLLSGTGTRSCASCHRPDKAFADGLVKNTILGDHILLSRNTPTILNAALQPALFYDLRTQSLEAQSREVVQNTKEMHGSMALSVDRLWQDTSYHRLFEKAFPKEGRRGIDTLEVMNAIGSYVRSLTFLNSRWDDYMRGDHTALTADEVNGFNIFMGKAKCGTCHYMPLFNGTFPPRFMKIETEVIGVPNSVAGKKIDEDMGRWEVVKAGSYKHAFKTPGLRNAARTAPYMHNGVYTTLEQVIDFYNRGGGRGLGLKIDNQTLPFDKLELTEKEKKDLVAFIRTLDSREFGKL